MHTPKNEDDKCKKEVGGKILCRLFYIESGKEGEECQMDIKTKIGRSHFYVVYE